MKLLVILLCLLSERYLVHAASYLRFNWFSAYYNKISENFKETNPAIIMLFIILPLIAVCALALYIADHLLFGFICFLLNVVIFYYCLGPENPFYPVREDVNEQDSEQVAGRYLALVNGQLFAVIFWYVVLGSLGALLYRLISLCREKELTADLAKKITNWFDWIPARITVLLYLIVGNFQKGFQFFAQNVMTSPEGNEILLSEGGLLAARTNESEPIQIIHAEHLVEHATIVCLVLLALFTLVALM